MGKEIPTLEKPNGMLYYGDNLEVLSKHIQTESVDLIYMDPPFNSHVNYNVIFKTKNKEDPPLQIQAFEDTWKWGTESEMAYSQILGIGDRISDVLKGLRQAIGENNMMAYVTMMAIRLIQLHRVLKPTGSLYLHCDPTASHYLKIILDAIFSPENFRNEIIWRRTFSHNDPKRFGSIHDTIFYYTKSNNFTWNRIFTEYTDDYIKERFRYKDKVGNFWPENLTAPKISKYDNGKPWRGIDPTNIGRQWNIPRELPSRFIVPTNWKEMTTQQKLDELDKQDCICWTKIEGSIPTIKRYQKDAKGKPLQDMILDIHYLRANSKERLGYPTQKPLTLLERIIESSSNEGDVVLDPFCGCGTTVHASQKLNRNWIGIDVTHLAIGLIEYRMKEAFGIKPTVLGIPTTFESAQKLANDNKFQFEAWAVTRIDRIMPNQKKGKDRGIDGRGYIPIGNDMKGNPNTQKLLCL